MNDNEFPLYRILEVNPGTYHVYKLKGESEAGAEYLRQPENEVVLFKSKEAAQEYIDAQPDSGAADVH